MIIPVVLCVVVKSNKLLLIQRIRGDYPGLWALPGGKIENNEHISESAVRELMEEAGIQANVEEYLGVVSEHLIRNRSIVHHFLLHLWKLTPENTKIKEGREGKVSWFNLDRIHRIKQSIIPSDYAMIEAFVKQGRRGYYNCILQDTGKGYKLTAFHPLPFRNIT